MGRGVMCLMLAIVASPVAMASTQCDTNALSQPLAVKPTLLVPVASGFAGVNPQLGSQRGVLAPALDEAQSVENVLWRLKVEGCQTVASAAPAAAALAGANAGAYVPKTAHDNTPYRFNMTQNGKRMTADDFDAWLKANGYSAGRRAESAAPASAEPAGEAPQGQ